MIKILYKFHRWAGLTLSVFVIFYSSTGILLNHRKAFDYFIDKQSTAQNVSPTDSSAITSFIDHYKKQINRSDDPKVIRIRQDNTIEFLYGSHGKTTYIINPESGKMEIVKKHSDNPLYFINSLHKAFGTSTFWIVLTDILSGILVLITLSSLVIMRYKTIDFIMVGAGVLLCFMGGYFA